MTPQTETQPPTSRKLPVGALGLAWSLGWRIAAGAFLGYQADVYLGWQGILTLFFSMAALVSGVRAMIKSGRVRPPAGKA